MANLDEMFVEAEEMLHAFMVDHISLFTEHKAHELFAQTLLVSKMCGRGFTERLNCMSNMKEVIKCCLYKTMSNGCKGCTCPWDYSHLANSIIPANKVLVQLTKLIYYVNDL